MIQECHYWVYIDTKELKVGLEEIFVGHVHSNIAYNKPKVHQQMIAALFSFNKECKSDTVYNVMNSKIS